MASLVSMAQAKKHLRITTADQDDDIWLKVDHASAIIMDYLKGRANKVATIVSSSVASPTVITTEEAHGYSNGDSVAITGHEDSVPDIYGAYVVSAVTELTFTIQVAVTTAGTGGTATVTWDDLTVPLPVQSAVLLMLTHLW